MPKPTSVAEYIASQPKAAQATLKLVRRIIREAMPEAEEVISYSIPGYRLGGRVVLYFAGWKAHYSLYPASKPLVARFEKALKPYVLSKGTIRLPLSEPVPVKLIEGIAKFRAKETGFLKI